MQNLHKIIPQWEYRGTQSVTILLRGYAKGIKYRSGGSCIPEGMRIPERLRTPELKDKVKCVLFAFN